MIAGLDIGATNFRAALGDEDKLRVVVQEDTCVDLEAQVEDALRALDESTAGDIEALGVSAAGVPDYERGRLKRIDVLEEELHDVELDTIASGALGLDRSEVYLENDVNAAVMGEDRYGIGTEEVDPLLYITFSTGIGSGLLNDDSVLQGHNGNAGKIGTCSLAMDINPKDRCGWEGTCAGGGIPTLVDVLLNYDDGVVDFDEVDAVDWHEGEVEAEELLQSGDERVEHALDRLDPRDTELSEIANPGAQDVYRLAKEGEEYAETVVREIIGHYNARGIATVVKAYDPERMAAGGGIVAGAEDLVLDPIETIIQESRERDDSPMLRYGFELDSTELEHPELAGAVSLPDYR